MNRTGYILAICLFLCGLTVSAQRYERVIRNNFWNESRNVTGMRQDTVSRSYAEAFGRFEGGGFRDTWQASKGWSAGASAASIRHLERISFAGAFSFEQKDGYDMCGSMFINPGFYPVDILEFTPGRKTLQTYAFNGGLSYDIADHWRIGGKVDFESANMSKRKDLRHTNWWLDMTVTPGFQYHKGDFAVGASYIFRKTSESIKAEQVGTAESSYYAFLDKGMMYGAYSVWTGSGLHLSEAGVNGFPVNDFSNGAALQFQYKGLFAEIEYLNTQGTIGEKEYIWFRFPGNEVRSGIGYRYTDGNSSHSVRIKMEWKRQGLDESILEKVTQNGISTVYNHGSNRIQTKDIFFLSPEYEYVTEKMELSIGAEATWRNTLSSQMYPYLYYQSVMVWTAKAEALLHLGRVDVDLNLAFRKGNCKESKTVVNESISPQTSPYRLQDWYDRHMEYITAPGLAPGLAVRYNFLNGIYLQAEAEGLFGFNLKYAEGKSRLGAAIRIGYNF